VKSFTESCTGKKRSCAKLFVPRSYVSASAL